MVLWTRAWVEKSVPNLTLSKRPRVPAVGVPIPIQVLITKKTTCFLVNAQEDPEDQINLATIYTREYKAIQWGGGCHPAIQVLIHLAIHEASSKGPSKY